MITDNIGRIFEERRKAERRKDNKEVLKERRKEQRRKTDKTNKK